MKVFLILRKILKKLCEHVCVNWASTCKDNDHRCSNLFFSHKRLFLSFGRISEMGCCMVLIAAFYIDCRYM